ncbi:MAG: hypothetical protein J7L98_01600 [Candidatus Verstraetearchaeota archaeon]|nr:hypothetical protein [Candidatus Verstraetearchaeota archaeon]
MSSEEALAQKVKRAVGLLLFQRHRIPGVKGWELRKAIGRDYLRVLEALKRRLADLGLELRAVTEDGRVVKDFKELADPERTRFFAVASRPLTATEATLTGWRLDSLAVLAATVVHLALNQGKAPRREVEELLREKFPEWKIDLELRRFTARGYIEEDEEGYLHIGWRTLAEVNLPELLQQIAGAKIEEES